MGLIGAMKQVCSNNQVKLCLWQLYRNIEINRNKIFGNIKNQNEDSLNLIKRIKTLVYIDLNMLKIYSI